MRSSSLCWRVSLLALCACLSVGSARADDNKEYLVKAAFIYNFVKFVEWPAGKAIATQSKIDICVLGDTPLASTGKVFSAASTPKLALSLVKENTAQDATTHCHVVFISQSLSEQLASILSAFNGKPVLTVSDMEGFARSGGMMGFVLDDNKIKIDVNKKAVTASGMRVDAQLLEIAHEVIDK